jgi:hypothetical protein
MKMTMAAMMVGAMTGAAMAGGVPRLSEVCKDRTACPIAEEAYRRAPPAVRQLIQADHLLWSVCLQRPQKASVDDEADMRVVCDGARNKIRVALDKLGWCDSEPGWAVVDYYWHKCGRGSGSERPSADVGDGDAWVKSMWDDDVEMCRVAPEKEQKDCMDRAWAIYKRLTATAPAPPPPTGALPSGDPLLNTLFGKAPSGP